MVAANTFLTAFYKVCFNLIFHDNSPHSGFWQFVKDLFVISFKRFTYRLRCFKRLLSKTIVNRLKSTHICIQSFVIFLLSFKLSADNFQLFFLNKSLLLGFIKNKLFQRLKMLFQLTNGICFV